MQRVVVLGDWFTRQNVSSVPSLLGLGTCQIGQVRGIASELWDSVEHLSRRWRKTDKAKHRLRASVKSSGEREQEQREHEDQGRASKVDVDVPGSAGFAANVFRVGIAGGVRTVCRWICGYRFCGRKLVPAAPWLGIGRGAHRGQPAPGYGGHAAGHLHDRRRGAQNDSASGFCASPLTKFLTTFWPWPEHTQSLSPCLLQD